MPTQILFHNVNDVRLSLLALSGDEPKTEVREQNSLASSFVLFGASRRLVELNGIEPMTSSLQSSRSPN